MKVVILLMCIVVVIGLKGESNHPHRHRHNKRVVGKELKDTTKIVRKPGIEQNKLFAEYGTNFRYIGEVKNGLDRVTVVTSVPIPRYRDIKKRPLQFANCTVDLSKGEMRHNNAHQKWTPQHTVLKWCAATMPYVNYLKTQERDLYMALRKLLVDDLYSALPELNQEPSMYADSAVMRDKPYDNGTLKNNKPTKRGLGAVLVSALPGLITLAVESISSFIKGKQQSRINKAVDVLRREDEAAKNQLDQYKNDFLMYGKYNVETLKNVIDTVNDLHDTQTQLEREIKNSYFLYRGDHVRAMDLAFDVNMFLRQAKDEHVDKYMELVRSTRELLDAIAILSQGRLPRSLFADYRLNRMLYEVNSMVKRSYPDYVLAANHISHYRDMKMVTFAVDQQAHTLIVAFPVFIKQFNKPPLSLYEVETVSVPIMDKNRQADSYTQVKVQKNYIAAGKDYSIQLRMTEMMMCKNIRYIFYCEELFVVKHKSKHSCVSTIFYNLGSKIVIENCQFDYYFNKTVPPVILDGGKNVLLANFQGPRSLKCNSVNGGLAKPAPEHTYAVVERSFLCDCQLDLEHASVLRQLSSCSKGHSVQLHMKFHVNLAFWELLKRTSPDVAAEIQPLFTEQQQVFDIRLFEGNQKRLDQPTDLENWMTKLSKDGTRLVGKGAPTQAPVIPLIPGWISNILVGITTLTTGALCAAVVVLLIKHFKMKAMMASLVIASLPPPLTAMPIVPYFKHIHGITKDCLDIMNTDPMSKIENFKF